MKRLLSGVAAVLLAGVVYAQLPKTKSVEGTKVYLEAPANGATVTSPFTVKFGLKGMGIAPAGINHPNTGHHHLLIDMEKLPDFSAALPANDNIRHFGGGQTEVDLTLAPGRTRCSWSSPTTCTSRTIGRSCRRGSRSPAE